MNLNPHKSSGPDNISTKLIQDSISEIIEPLIHIYNLSLSTGIVPEKLKMAKVIPIFKKGDESVISNYRPISLLSVFDKMLEKVMYTRLESYFNKHNILYDYQFGFRNKYSTNLALIDLLDKLYSDLDNKNFVIGIYCDLQKAFDSCNHEILLYKLNYYGIRGITLNWFKSYLNNRTQYVSIDNIKSTLGRVTCGVPQGSVLGPLLFLIYINDIHIAVKHSIIKLFADDTNMFISSKNIIDLCEICNEQLKKLNDWFSANKICINVDKTVYSVFGPGAKIDLLNDYNCSLVLNGMILKQVSCSKYLGVFIDDELKWKTHINYVVKKLLKYVGIFYKLRSYLPLRTLKQLYYAFVHSNLIYCIEIYGNAPMSYLDPIKKLTNRILRILQNKPLSYPVKLLYSNFNTLPFSSLHKLYVAKFVHQCKFSNCNLPGIFLKLLL